MLKRVNLNDRLETIYYLIHLLYYLKVNHSVLKYHNNKELLIKYS